MASTFKVRNSAKRVRSQGSVGRRGSGSCAAKTKMGNEAAAASENEGFQELWLNMRENFIARTRRWLAHLSESGRLGDVDIDLTAEALGCMTEQMAYVNVGLPAATPRRERIDDLGRALGQMWYRAVTPPTSAARRPA